MNLTAPSKPDAKPYVDHVGACMAEVMAAVLAWRTSCDEHSRLFMDSRLAELEHACKLARRVL